MVAIQALAINSHKMAAQRRAAAALPARWNVERISVEDEHQIMERMFHLLLTRWRELGKKHQTGPIENERLTDV
jgi:hypothetical protein